MSSMYHSGEIRVQTLAGVRDMASKIGQIIRSEMPRIAQDYLSMQCMVVVGTRDANERMWVTALAGKPGFAHAADERTVQVDVLAPVGDPIYQNLAKGGPIGFIATDFVTHRRMRVNGIGQLGPSGLTIFCEEVYSNCGRYIQTRKPEVAAVEVNKPQGEYRDRKTSKSLSHAQQEWIRTSDTFFIASSHSEMGADVSHKGGPPGFVQVISDTELEFPDYHGNSMFNTLGNILLNPHVGLLFLDFTHGHTLQLTGKAEVVFGEDNERKVSVTVEEIIEVPCAIPLSYGFIEYAKTNPKLSS
jgi:uncharacterized protein